MTSTSTKIDVAVRVRPLLEHEKNAGLRQTYLKTALGSNEVRLYEPDGKNNKVFTFDKVCSNNCAQEEFFETVEMPKYVDHVLEGYNATVFVYGQTGAGKTYTMEGLEYDLSPNRSVHQKQNKILGVKDAGIIPRVIRDLFNKIPIMARKYNRNYNVYCSFAELYNEKIFDLLNPDQLNRINPMSPGLKLRWHKKDQFIVENLYVFACSSPEELEFLFQMGVKNKTMASHKLNSSSSRSHCIFEIKVEFADAANPDDVIVSKLALVDLAGSERTAVVSSDGRMAKEAIEINKSLFTLRQVINAIYESQNKGANDYHIPYRESKLTSLLKQSIGGNSYCLMIACLSPSDESFEENVSTLGYATKAKKIQNEPVRNDDPKWEQLQFLKAENADLIQKLNEANKQILFLTQSLQKQTKLVAAYQSKVGPEAPQSPSRFASVSFGQETPSLRIPLMTDTTSQGEMPPEAFHVSEHLTQQLVVAINQIRDLLEVIKKEKDRNERLTLKLDQNENILSTVMQENQELRDQILNPDGTPKTRAYSNSISSQASAQQYKLLAPAPLMPSTSAQELLRSPAMIDLSGYKQAVPVLSSMPKNPYDGRHSPCSGQSGYSGSTRTASTPEPSQPDTYYKSTNRSSSNTSYRKSETMSVRDVMGTPTDLRPDIGINMGGKTGFEYRTPLYLGGVTPKEYYEDRGRDKSPQERSKERSTTPGGRPRQISGGSRDYGNVVKTPVNYEKREW